MAIFNPEIPVVAGEDVTELLLKELMADSDSDLPHSSASSFSRETNEAVAEMIHPQHGKFSFEDDDDDEDFYDINPVFDIDEFDNGEEIIAYGLDINQPSEQVVNSLDQGTEVVDTQVPQDFVPSSQEEDAYKKFSCSCDCLKSVPPRTIMFIRRTMIKFSRRERHLFLLSRLQRDLPLIKEDNFRIRYHLASDTELCSHAYEFVFAVGNNQLFELRKVLYTHGINDVTHGLKGRRSNHALSDSETELVLQFLVRKAIDFGRYSPIAISQKEAPPIYFPAGTLKVLMYKDYYEGRKNMGGIPVSIRTFKRIWQEKVPHIKVQNRRTDVCNTCDFLVHEIAHNKQDDDLRDQMVDKLVDHREKAARGRGKYKLGRVETRDIFQKYDIDTAKVFPEYADDSVRMIAYDFAQLSFVPHNTDQRNSIYYKVPLKVQKFGIVEEGSLSNTYYLFDEGSTVDEDGKGTHGVNAVLSFVYHYLKVHRPMKEKKIIAQADNCVGQNKNKFVFWFYSYLILIGFVEEVELHFLQVGHTKFACDLFFGLFSRKYNLTDTTLPKDLQDIGNRVSNSSALLYGEEGRSWNWYDWKSFLEGHFIDIKGLTKLFYYKLYKGNNNRIWVSCRSDIDAEPEEFSLTQEDGAYFNTEPVPLKPNGLSAKRADYLIAMKDHARPEKREEFVEHINQSRATVKHPAVPEESDEEEEAEDPAIVQPVDELPDPPIADVVFTKTITDEIRAALVNKKEENPRWILKDLQKWLEEEYRVSVQPQTVGNHLRRGIKEKKSKQE